MPLYRERDYLQMLEQAVEGLPKGVKVVLLADRGFVHTNLMGKLTSQWGWHYRIRVKKDTWIWRSGKGWCQLKDFHFKGGSALCFHNVRLHKELPVWISASHFRSQQYQSIVSDEKTTLKTFAEYEMRFDIIGKFPRRLIQWHRICSDRRFALCVLSLGCGLFSQWRPSTSPPKALLWSRQVNVGG
ncbi:MAG: hypothetical protein AB4426_25130 [Xenococcaceae cyanobacterium]